MRKLLKWLLGTALLLIAIAIGGAWWGYRAVMAAPEFYQQMMTADPLVLAEESQKLESRMSVLVSDAQKPGVWQTTVSADELNGWLGHKLPESYPELLPPEIQDPRVLVKPEAFTLAVKTKLGSVESVVTLALDVYVTETQLLAIEIKSARAGRFPLPVAPIVKDLQKGTMKTDLPVLWTQTDGRPVMLIDIDNWSDNASEVRRLNKVELADGELYLSGTTELVEAVAESE